MKINPERPIEELVGDNCGIVRLRLGALHCMTPFTEQVRACRPKNIRKASPALRRGLVKLVYETMKENRDLYRTVS